MADGPAQQGEHLSDQLGKPPQLDEPSLGTHPESLAEAEDRQGNRIGLFANLASQPMVEASDEVDDGFPFDDE